MSAKIFTTYGIIKNKKYYDNALFMKEKVEMKFYKE